MGHYKFCHTRDIDRILGGSLRFGSLAHFRREELRSGKPAIGDGYEGLAEVRAKYLSIEGPGSPEQNRQLGRLDMNLRRLNVPNAPPGELIFKNTRLPAGVLIEKWTSGKVEFENHTSVKDCGHWLVFSFSNGDLATLAKSMREGADKKYRYDAAIEILDHKILLEAIWESGRVDDRPVKEVFEQKDMQPITYLERTQDVESYENRLTASPFYKRPLPEFISQHEIRIALKPRDPCYQDIAYIQIGPRNDLFKEEFRNPSPGAVT